MGNLESTTYRYPKYPREYPRVTSLEEVDRNDFVALANAQNQWVRDRTIDLEEVKVLRERLNECVRREEVNHPQNCREIAEAYLKAFKKYRSEGWYR